MSKWASGVFLQCLAFLYYRQYSYAIPNSFAKDFSWRHGLFRTPQATTTSGCAILKVFLYPALHVLLCERNLVKVRVTQRNFGPVARGPGQSDSPVRVALSSRHLWKRPSLDGDLLGVQGLSMDRERR